MRKLLILTVFFTAFLSAINLNAQDFSNKGKDFWVGYGYHQVMTTGNGQEMVLYFATDAVTTVTVEIPLIGYSITYNNIPANTSFTSNPLPKTGFEDARLLTEGLSRTGIHITSDKPIVAYAHIYNASVSGATLLFPTATLGKEYYSVNYEQVSNAPDANSWVYAIAVDTGITTIEIIPSATTLTHNPNEAFTVDLEQGQIYNLMGVLQPGTAPYRGVDLTGTKISSITSSNGSCKRIAVFSGSGRISVSCLNGAASSDNIIVQAFPKNAWGRKYLTVPTSSLPTNFYRVCIQEPGTVVSVNGVPLTGLVGGFYYQFSTDQPSVIEANNPIMVAQVMTSQNQCGNGMGDPEVIYLSPVEQNIDKVILNSTSNFAINQHWINVVIKASAVGSFTLDGANTSSSFITHPQDPAYVYAQINVGAGQHILAADSGFNAIAYGLGTNESYGYNAGTNVKDLYQFVSVENEYATVNFPASCAGTPFFLSMTFPYIPTQIVWDFNGLFPNVTDNNPQHDSTWTVNGKILYRFPLSTAYNTASVGTFPIKVIAQNPTADACGSEQEINYDLQIFAQPVAAFDFETNGCISDPVSFTDMSNTDGRTITQWIWEFGDAATSDEQNPTHVYPAAGSYNAKLKVITDIGCVSNSAQNTVNLTQSPLANFTTAGLYCQGNTITFTNNSTSPTSPIVKWIWNFGDGSPLLSAITGDPQTHAYSSTGTFIVTLVVETASGCKSGFFPDSVIIDPAPVAAFAFGNGCLPNAVIQFTDASTLNGAPAPFTYVWNFGNGITSTEKNPLHTFTTSGSHDVSLSVTSAGGCVDDTTQSVTTIYTQPQAAFTANKTESCLGEAITFTDNNSSAPNSTITEWQWNFGDGSAVVVAASNIPQTHTYTTAGTYTVTLTVKSAVGCISTATPLTIAVTPAPTASFIIAGQRCSGNEVNLTSTSVSNVPNAGLTSFTWSVNNTVIGTDASIVWTPATAGDFQIKLVVVTATGCTDDTTMTVTVYPKPVPDFSLPNVCLPAGVAQFNNLTTINDGSISTVTYVWNFGDGTGSVNAATNAPQTHTYTGAGPFEVTLTATSANGCFAVANKQLTTVFAQPQAQIVPSAEVCLGSPVSITNQSTAPGSTVASYLWTFDDGSIQTTSTAVKTFTTAGLHSFTLKVTSAASCQSETVTGTVMVNPLPVARYIITSPLCEKAAVTFTDGSLANAGTIVKWTWEMGDGTAAFDRTPPFTYTYNAIGSYTVKLIVQTDKGCTSPAFDSSIVINALPVPAFTMPENCVNDPVSQFTDNSTVSSGAITSWLWNFGDINASPANPNTSTNQNGRHKYSQATNYTVSLTATSDKGCVAATSQIFTVNGSTPESRFSVTGGNNACSNNTVSIINNPSVDVGKVVKLEIFWDDVNNQSNKTTDEEPEAGETYNINYPQFFSPASKQIAIRVRAYSGEQCFDDSVITITLHATPQIQFSAQETICADVPAFNLGAAVTNVSGDGIYSGTGVSNTGLFNPRTAGAGSHTIRYTFTSTAGCTSFAEQTIKVAAVPVVDAGPATGIGVLEGGTITLPATASGNGLQYVWTPATWLSNNLILRPVAAPLRDTTYTLTVTSQDGCTATDFITIKVLKGITVPNVFTPNGDGINDKWEITYLESYQNASIQLYNRYGQLIFQSKGYSRPWDGTVNGKEVPFGTYYYVIDPKNGRKPLTGFVDIIR